MDKEILMFDDTEIEKEKLYRSGSPIFLEDANVNNVLVFYKITSHEKAINALLVNCIITMKLIHYI